MLASTSTTSPPSQRKPDRQPAPDPGGMKGGRWDGDMSDEYDHPMQRRSDMAGEPSLWEIGRRLDRQDERIEKGFSKVEGKIDALQFVPITLYHSEQLHQDDRIKTLEDANTRKSQLIAGALVAIAVNVVVLLIAAKGGL